jgi:glutaminyl-peptide cyclotransferase
MRALIALLGAVLMVSATVPEDAQQLRYTIVARTPHDRSAYTEGLIFKDGGLFESVGQYGCSDVRHVRLSDGKVVRARKLSPEVFGEGLTEWKGELISLTWKTGVGYRWRASDLKRIKRFRYPGEGWGLTHDDKHLYMSDGTAEIRMLDPLTFAETGRIAVSLNGFPLDQLNELEWVHGSLYANVWQSEEIVRIDPKTGKVTGIIDLSALVSEVNPSGTDSVLNGIAYDERRDLLLVTGKNWPTLFAIRLGAH